MLRLSYEKRNHGGSNEGCSKDQSKTEASLFDLCIDKSFVRALFSLSFSHRVFWMEFSVWRTWVGFEGQPSQPSLSCNLTSYSHNNYRVLLF